MQELPRSLKLATVWLLIGLVVFLAVQWMQQRERRSQFSASGAVIELRRAADGHFHWPGRVNGVAVDFLLDTGATGTTLPLALAQQAGLESIGSMRSETAAGVVSGQIARADIELDGGVRLTNLRVSVLPRLSSPLLGMDVLGKLHFTQADGVMRLDTANGGWN
jgi:aspartyl protease family protein